MPLYTVERLLPGADLEAVEAIRQAAEDACEALATEGRAVRYLRSTFTPGDSRCRCLFEADTAALVRQANDLAQLPYNRIVLAVEFPNRQVAKGGATT